MASWNRLPPFIRMDSPIGMPIYSRLPPLSQGIAGNIFLHNLDFQKLLFLDFQNFG